MNPVFYLLFLIVVIYFLAKRVFKNSHKEYCQSEFNRGYDYAFTLYEYVNSQESHDKVMERIFNESEIGYEFAGGLGVDHYDKGMRKFYFEKLGEQYND